MGAHNWLVKYPEDLGSAKVELQCTQCPAHAWVSRQTGRAGPGLSALATREGVLPTCEEEKVRQVMES